MDANKLAKLKVVGYQVRKVCANCVHSFFPSRHTDWGTCSKFTYDHLKHTDTNRQLSIHKTGKCDSYEKSPTATSPLNLGGFAELVE